MPSDTHAPLSESSVRSGKAFLGLLPLVLLVLGVPQMPPSLLLGLAALVLGALMVLLPPKRRVPRLWLVLAGAFLLVSLAGFLPRGLAATPAWRAELDALALDTGGLIFAQPALAFEDWLGLALSTLFGLYLVSHRVESRLRQRLAAVWALGVALLAVIAMALAGGAGDGDAEFGFFAEPEPSATLMAMALVVGAGSLVQAIRRKNRWLIGFSLVAVALPAIAALAYLPGDAAIVLAGLGLLASIALMGFRYLKGQVAKVSALLILAATGFIVVRGTIDEAEPSEDAAPVAEATQPATSSSPAASAPLDRARVASAMILAEPWAGVGQFAAVAPQYSGGAWSAAPADPASDWLQLVAESGALPAVALLALVVLVARRAHAGSRTGNARSVTIACLVAALLVPVHGILAVPGHQLPLAWAGIWLAALALPSEVGRSRRSVTLPPALGKAWQFGGGVVALAGLAALTFTFLGQPPLPSQQAERHARRAAELMSAAPSTSGVDAVAQAAIGEIDAALRIRALDAELHHRRARIGLQMGPAFAKNDGSDGSDGVDAVERQFSVERILRPRAVEVPLRQAAVLVGDHPGRVPALFRDAMARAEADPASLAGGVDAANRCYAALLAIDPKPPELWLSCAELAAGHPERQLRWLWEAPTELLAEVLPGWIRQVPDPIGRTTLVEQWRKRDPAGAAGVGGE